ncbi:uncharacterized protein An08g09780 [Aspergillus niger]|uniref:Contig An08c0230, genomic contig n=2 Tax=Aspergillus niger TaxID=5061 RepID=A5ABC1_ASPNC|nr:uncharacterized protein An08g09780 [Aspergillus niger]CAK96755.1 unnamed protein product [Aspergillus niger]
MVLPTHSSFPPLSYSYLESDTSMPFEKLRENTLPVADTQDSRGQKTILNLMSNLHLSSEYSDLKIICKDKIFPAHKLLETKGSICLDDKSPVLIEKVLEFLYTGNYTLGYRTTKTLTPPTDDNEGPRMNTNHTRDPLIYFPSRRRATDEYAAEMEELANDAAVAAVENSADGFVDGSPMNKKGPNEEENNVEPAVDILADCHPCYFHVRMYGEADYFMIDDLKIKAEEKVLASLVNCSEVDSFSQIIAELYSGRADYGRLRKLALKVIVDNLPTLRKGFTPVINAKLMESVPDFAVDLCLPTIDNTPVWRVQLGYPSGKLHISGIHCLRSRSILSSLVHSRRESWQCNMDLLEL